MQFIVKVQRPIVTSNPDHVDKVYIYNEDRSIETWQPSTRNLKKWFDGDMKIYMYANYNKTTGILTLVRMAPWQSW